MVTGILAVLSAAAAAGIRIALPLLMIGMSQNELWFKVPLLSRFDPQVLVAILISWSLFELFGSKNLLGQRVLQLIQLIFSPLVGALMSLTIANIIEFPVQLLWIIAIVGGSLAFVIQLVQVGWFFRLRGIPIWATFMNEILCIILVILSLKSPEKGGLIALLLLWLVIRSAGAWRCGYTYQ
ncbi:DUF4126 domain-containing protein [Aphanothece hegewaldii]|uniref:DUF4126 domain-containing protein n=1 Tax=Aphanothece hegewaldii TaxID=1521625 RepID=UPI001C628345|nr:DUF4126 domain-containing protein [Aphanothece hegewaldii]